MTRHHRVSLRPPSAARWSDWRPLVGAGLCSLTALLAQQTPPAPAAKPPVPGDDVITLSAFTVTTTADKGYRAGNSVSATRIDTPIKDLPFAISAFTPQFIEDVGARDLFDVVKYAPAVTSAGREFNAGNTRFNIRGFDQLTPQRNGFVGTGYVDTVNVQRIENVKGPASILYGQIQPGGTVNIITKTAAAKPFTLVSQQIGTDSFWRTALDVNQPIRGESVLFRFNGSWENGFEHIQPAETRTWVISPTLTWKITKNSSLTLDYQWFHRRENPPVFMKPNIRIEGLAISYTSPDGKTFTPIDYGFGPFFPLPREFNYVGKNDHRHADFESIYGEYTIKFNDHWTARANYNWNKRGVKNKLTGVADARIWASGVRQTATAFAAVAGNTVTTAANGAPTVTGTNGSLTFNPADGAVTYNFTGPAVFLPRRARLQEEFGQGNVYQAEVAGKYEFGGDLKWKPLFGAFYNTNNGRSRQRQQGDFYQPWNLLSPSTWVDTPSSFGLASPALMANGDYNVAALPVSSNSITFGKDTAYYTVQNVSFFKDRLMLIGGARYNRAESAGDNFLVAPDPATVAGRNEINNNSWTSVSKTIYQGGAGYKILPALMAYASYSESFSVDNRFLLFRGEQSGKAKPSTAKGTDFGLKSDLWDGRFSATVSVFEIKQKDRVLNFSERVGTQSLTTQLQDTQDRSRGWEIETTLSPLSNWQVYLSYSDIDIKLTSVPVGLDPLLNAHPEASVKYLFNCWTRYTFLDGALKGAWIGGGANYTGDKAQRVDNRLLTMPAYTLWDATIGYDWKWQGHDLSANLAWKNISDKEYFPANQQRGLPERFVLSVSAKF
jgi:iron complex outermembrane receptor protein